MKLGAAFQKINFLRDLHADYNALGRVYFPNVDMTHFDEPTKKAIEKEIKEDFRLAYIGVLQLPKEARFGVLIAFQYYYKLFIKIQALSCERILNERIRVANPKKIALLAKTYVQHNLNLL
jgi:phytoene/squalene synthetase